MSLWIDLTDFLQWKGNLTGIQRIQFNISKLYIESSGDVKFFVYDSNGRSFSQVTFNPDEIVKAGIIDASSGDIRSESKPSLSMKIRDRLGAKVKPASTVTSPTAPFTDGDTVLIMGGIWVGSFIDDLSEMKETHKFKLVHFAFDMIPSLLPGYVVEWLPDAFTSYQKKVFSISEGIIAISKSTAKDVRGFIKLHDIKNNPKISVVRIGETIDELEAEKREKRIDGLEPGFILSVSTIEARKNHLALLYMLKEADRRSIELPTIVIVGRQGWHTEDFDYIARHDELARQKIVILNDVDDDALVWLYRNCLFTVFPSFYEGWGMPVAESLAYGKLCLSSDASSMPEIAGDLIDYFSPYDTGQMLDVVAKYLDTTVLADKERAIRKTYKPTSWRQMYESIEQSLRSIR